MEELWLAATYHFPSTYSLRIPMSSATHTRIMPAPGPGTVRLALIRTSIELFGLQMTHDQIFPWVRTAKIRIRPPQHIGISSHTLQAHKWDIDRQKKRPVIQESLMLREMAQTNDGMTIYISRAKGQEDQCRTLLQAVGYWGQTSSFAQCTTISQTAPVKGEYAVPVSSLDTQHPLASYFLCFASEFRDEQCSWKEVVEEIRGQEEMLQLDVYAWPLIIAHQQKAGKVLTWHPLPQKAEELV
jgi:hypothetical protein